MSEAPGQPGPASVPAGASAWLVLVAAALAGMMDGLDSTGLAVANPVIARGLHASLPGLEAVTTDYMLAMAASLVVAGKLGDRYGHRRIFLVGLAGFALSSAMTGLSGAVTEMAVWRLVQGACGGMMMASALALLRHAFPPGRFKIAVGLFTGGLALATLIGPFIGGALVEYVSWRAIFYVNLPVAALAVLLAARHAPQRTRVTDPGRLDVAGVVLLAAAVFMLVSGVSRAGTDGWLAVYPLAALSAAVLLILGFVMAERFAASPGVPLTLFRPRPTWLGLAVILAGGLTHFGTAYYFSFYLQQFRGLSPVLAGAGLLPMIGLVAFGGPLSGFLNQRYRPRWPVAAGLLLLTAGELGLFLTGLDAPLITLIPWLLPLGLGVGLALPTATEMVVSGAPPQHAGIASGLQQTVLMISGALAVAVFGSVIAASAPGYAHVAMTHSDTAFLTGLDNALLVGAGLTAVAAGMVIALLPRARASG